MKKQTDRHPQTYRYHTFAKLLHWLMAMLIIGMLCLGWYMMSVANQPGTEQYFDLHKSFGLVIAGLILIRVIWRSSHRPGPLLSIPKWQAKLANVSHLLLYTLMIAMPLTGIFETLFSEYGLIFFGYHLPTFNPNKVISERLALIHSYIAWGLVTLISIHILAALKHLLTKNDLVFQQMWFRKRDALTKQALKD